MSNTLWRCKKFLALAAGLAAFSVVAFACGGDDEDDGGGDTTPAATSSNGDGETDFSDLSGQVVVDGSSTVGPVAEAAAEEFGKVSDVQVSVGISGTGGGFEKFCRGETDISTASRAIKDSEVEACAADDIEFVEVKIGIDALTVVVNPNNDWIDCATFSTLKNIFDQGSTVNNWNQVDPSYPDQELTVYSPGADSGTFDFLTETVNGVVDQFRNNGVVTFSEDDNVLVQGVENDEGAIGYFGFAYFQENQDQLRALHVDKDQSGTGTPVAEASECVEPGEATVLAGSYPLSRPLFMYVSQESLDTEPQVGGYVQFLLENPQLVSEVGYVELPPAEYEAGLGALAAN